MSQWAEILKEDETLRQPTRSWFDGLGKLNSNSPLLAGVEAAALPAAIERYLDGEGDDDSESYEEVVVCHLPFFAIAFPFPLLRVLAHVHVHLVQSSLTRWPTARFSHVAVGGGQNGTRMVHESEEDGGEEAGRGAKDLEWHSVSC